VIYHTVYSDFGYDVHWAGRRSLFGASGIRTMGPFSVAIADRGACFAKEL
jgi:hypothetical protein